MSLLHHNDDNKSYHSFYVHLKYKDLLISYNEVLYKIHILEFYMIGYLFDDQLQDD
jgi:hypothetical protein